MHTSLPRCAAVPTIQAEQQLPVVPGIQSSREHECYIGSFSAVCPGSHHALPYYCLPAFVFSHPCHFIFPHCLGLKLMLRHYSPQVVSVQLHHGERCRLASKGRVLTTFSTIFFKPRCTNLINGTICWGKFAAVLSLVGELKFRTFLRLP